MQRRTDRGQTALTLRQRPLQGVVLGLQLGDEVAALQVLTELLPIKEKTNKRQLCACPLGGAPLPE